MSAKPRARKSPKNFVSDDSRVCHGLWVGVRRELQLAAVVARYHRGALPTSERKNHATLDLPDRRSAMESAGILRLANALDTRPPGTAIEKAHTPQVHVRKLNAPDRSVVVRVAGYSAMDRSAEAVAAARHLLETVLRRLYISATPCETERRSRQNIRSKVT